MWDSAGTERVIDHHHDSTNEACVKGTVALPPRHSASQACVVV
jgi:hypothetical protein